MKRTIEKITSKILEYIINASILCVLYNIVALIFNFQMISLLYVIVGYFVIDLILNLGFGINPALIEIDFNSSMDIE